MNLRSIPDVSVNPSTHLHIHAHATSEHTVLQNQIASLLRGVTRSPAANTKTVGLRWDFYSNFALKLQYDRTQAENRSRGGFINARPTFPVNGKANVYTVALDFLF